MTILLYKDGRLVIDDGNPIEGKARLEGLVACVSDPQSGDTLKFDGNQWVAGAAASGLPAVSGDDNGKVLTVVEGEWAPAAGGGGGGANILILNSTYDETAQTSVLDKTVNEIIAAVESGAIIMVREYTTYGPEYSCITYIAKAGWYVNDDEVNGFNLTAYDGSGYYAYYIAVNVSDYPYMRTD